MKKKYYDFLNILITDYGFIRNVDFYRAFLAELIFIFFFVFVKFYSIGLLNAACF